MAEKTSSDQKSDTILKSEEVQSAPKSDAGNEKEQNNSLPNVTFEDILEKLGCFGPFQLLSIFLYSSLEIACAFVAFIPILVGRPSSLVNCSSLTEENLNATITQSILSTTQPTSFTQRTLFDILPDWNSFFKYESIVDEWDLTCDKAWVPDIFTSCLMAGMIFGNIFASLLADWYGRKKCYLIMVMFMALSTLLSAFSPSFYVYALSRFISGFAFCGFYNTTAMAVIEMMSPKWRSVANSLGPTGEGIMLLGLLGHFISSWRMLYLATLVPYLFAIPIYKFLPESPRWLLRNNRTTEAQLVLNYMARINGRQPISFEELEAVRLHEQQSSQAQQENRISYAVFLKNRTLRKTSIYLFLIWFAWNTSYYGISYNIRNVPGNPYVNVALIGLANAVGLKISFLICDWFGRRKAVLFSMSFSASFLVALAVCFLAMRQVNPNVVLIGCFFGIVGMACCRASARLFSAESFPTPVRTMGLGVGSLGANSAGILTPHLAFLGSIWPSLPFFVFSKKIQNSKFHKLFGSSQSCNKA